MCSDHTCKTFRTAPGICKNNEMLTILVLIYRSASFPSSGSTVKGATVRQAFWNTNEFNQEFYPEISWQQCWWNRQCKVKPIVTRIWNSEKWHLLSYPAQTPSYSQSLISTECLHHKKSLGYLGIQRFGNINYCPNNFIVRDCCYHFNHFSSHRILGEVFLQYVAFLKWKRLYK